MFTNNIKKEIKEINLEWQTEYQKYYKNLKCSLSTDSGIEVKPVYTPEDIDGIDFRQIGLPGVFPFTRGNYPLMYQSSMWTTQQGMGHGTPEKTRERYDLLRNEGLDAHEGMVPQYFIVPDAIVQEGYDPDHLAAKGQIGVVGTNWCNTNDMEILFHDLPLDKTGVVFPTYDVSLPTLGMYQATAEKMGFNANALRGHTVANFYRQVCWDLRSFHPENSLKVASDFIRYCSKYIPLWSPISFQGYGFQEAGATAIQELAFVLATAIAFTESTMKLGIAADDFVNRYGFHFAIDDDFFESIAKLRAFRRMWSKTTRERWGCKKPQSFKTIIQAETAGTSLTAQQPLNNLVRAGIQTLAAVLGGATSIWTTHYDEALSIPTEESATLSLRTQQVIYHETNAANVADPLGGSYFLEWLTEKIEAHATSLARKIEKMGYLNCWCNGWLRRELEDSAFKWRQKLESKKKIKVGVNKYKVEEEMEIKTHQSDPATEEIIVNRIQEFRKKRDSTKTKAAIAEIEKAAINLKKNWPNVDIDLMPAIIDAVKKGATLGETMEVLKAVFGWSFLY